MSKKFVCVAVFVPWFGFHALNSNAQFVVQNNGVQAFVRPGCLVSIKSGDLVNNGGNFSNSGTVTVEGSVMNNANLNGGGTTGQFNVAGNWVNNGVFNADQTTVALNGANQLIGGSAISSFYNLDLQGSGIKTLAVNSAVTNELRLNDRELATQANTMHVTNTATNAIAYTTGFVSGTGNGRLRWDMAGSGPYVFPVGSSVGTPRVRPVQLMPASGNNSFAVRMANVNPTVDGYTASLVEPGICAINPNFYSLIDRVNGTATTGVGLYYVPSQDGNWADCAHWASANQWQDMGNGSYNTSGSYAYISQAAWNDFSIPAFSLSKAAPTVSMNGLPPSFCQNNGTISLSGTPSGGTFSGPGVSGGVFNPMIAGLGSHNISYTFIDATGCQGVASQNIQVTSAPIVTLNLNGPPSFCQGQSVNIQATPGFTSYQWNNSATTSSISVSQAGQYNVTVTDANGCSGTSANANITVYPIPNPVITSNGPLEFCQGQSVTLSVGNLYTSYSWSNNATTFSTIVTQAGQYTCTVTNQYLCSATSEPVDVSIIPGITGTIFSNGNTLWVEPAGSGYQWFLNGNPIPGATGSTYIASQSGNYSVQYTGDNGCPANSYVLEFTYVSVDDIGPFSNISLYPNPGNGDFVIEGTLGHTHSVSIGLFDITGRAVKLERNLGQTLSFRENITIRDLAKGVYMVRVRANDHEVVFRYVRQ